MRIEGIVFLAHGDEAAEAEPSQDTARAPVPFRGEEGGAKSVLKFRGEPGADHDRLNRERAPGVDDAQPLVEGRRFSEAHP